MTPIIATFAIIFVWSVLFFISNELRKRRAHQARMATMCHMHNTSSDSLDRGDFELVKECEDAAHELYRVIVKS